MAPLRCYTNCPFRDCGKPLTVNIKESSPCSHTWSALTTISAGFRVAASAEGCCRPSVRAAGPHMAKIEVWYGFGVD
jgi:hypothetical protein